MRIWTLAALSAVSLLTVGCTSSFSNKQGAPVEEHVFRYPINSNPTSFDPGVVQDGDTIDLLQNVYEGLVTWNEDNQVTGAVAENWDITDGGKTYVFHLRKGVKFHNGREVKAQDFKWSIERLMNPKFKSPTATSYLDDIVGVTERKEGKLPEVTGYQVVDDYTLKIQLKKVTPYFLGKLTYIGSFVLPKESVPELEEISDVKQMVGCGPYTVASYAREQETVLQSFKDYHGGAPKLQKIIRPVIKDAMTKLTKFKNGELDLANLQRQDIEGVEADAALKPMLKLFERPAIWYVAMNQLAYPPFKDVRVRRAFAMAVDKKEIVENRMGKVNQIANGIVPPGIQGYRPDAKGTAFNKEEAKKLLAEAGYGPGKPMPPLELYFREAFPDIKLVAEAVAGMLSDAFNEPGKPKTVDVKLKTLEWRAYLEKFNRKELPFYHMRWAADYLDPQNFLSQMLATWGPENKLGYNSPQFDKFCREADSQLDWQKRLPLYAQAEDTALQDAVWIPIYFQRDAELQRPELVGMRESLFGHLPHTTTDVVKQP